MSFRASVLLVGHGSRVERSNREFEAVVEAFRARRPDLALSHAYIELAEPLLADGLRAAGASGGRVAVLPLFLFAAGHVKREIPEAVEAAAREAPATDFILAPHIGVDPAITALAAERVAAALGGAPAAGAGIGADETILVVIGRGSSDAEANGDFFKVARLVGEAVGLLRVEPCFIGITRPLLGEALERLGRAGARRIVFAPYLVFDGLLVERIRDAVAAFGRDHPEIDVRLAAPLFDGRVPEALLDLLDERLAEAGLPAAAAAG